MKDERRESDGGSYLGLGWTVGLLGSMAVCIGVGYLLSRWLGARAIFVAIAVGVVVGVWAGSALDRHWQRAHRDKRKGE